MTNDIAFVLIASSLISLVTSLILLSLFWKQTKRIVPFLEACLCGILLGPIIGIADGVLVYNGYGFISLPDVRIGSTYYTGELVALVLGAIVGNIAIFLLLRFRLRRRPV